ncbi:response regulator transcription factor [Maribacter sp. ANRC-HE7]|uniref:Response regulator transcription factor n=1 Tax=Maribacter aquimaris TaxID=2737171 RepID=A0ABR7UWH7_9FLAO|nr:response regulator transcription factor [Maribacter aquimaris]MBD0776512.1 response regulator transcription factor [Maribacter aquimaris]
MKIVRLLSVDDHAMTAMGYKYILEGAEFDGFQVKVDTVNTFEGAIEKIDFSERSIPYDILLLDISLFPTHSNDTRSGEDLGVYARSKVPTSKIVFMSSFSDSYRINSIFKTVDPDGYMVKSEIDEKSLCAMVRTVLERPPYYTASALSAIRKKMANDFDLVDETDKKILHYISTGIRTKDIGPLISVAPTTVESRKRQLKQHFGIEQGNDIELIEEARKRGFI